MGNIGEDPSEYLPRRDTQAAPSIPPNKYPPSNNNNYETHSNASTLNESQNSGGANMNGPTSVAMYERQSPNPVHMNHQGVSGCKNFICLDLNLSDRAKHLISQIGPNQGKHIE